MLKTIILHLINDTLKHEHAHLCTHTIHFTKELIHVIACTYLLVNTDNNIFTSMLIPFSFFSKRNGK